MEAHTLVSAPAHTAEVQLEAIQLPRPSTLGRAMPLGMRGDERLARLVGEGNERAFDTLFARYHQQLYRYCHSMVRHEADAQDALQSTFTAALVALRRGQRDAPLRPWLFRIAHNEAISLLRKRRPGVELSEELTSSQASVEETAQDRARLAQLVADLRMLPERQRSALVMRELSGLSHEDLAHALGISVGAAKQTVFEARRALQDFAEGRAMSCEEIQRTLSNQDGRNLRGRRVRAHLQECYSCSTFAAAIPERRAALMALSPALPTMTAAGLLAKITGAGSTHHGGGGSGLLAGATGKSMGLAVSAKTLATGAAIMATAAAGTVGAVEIATHAAHPAVTRGLIRSGDRSGSISAGGQSGHATTGLKNLVVAHPTGRYGHGSTGTSGGTHSRSGSAHSRAGGNSPSTAGRSSTVPGSGASGSAAPGSQGSSSTNPNAHGGNPNAGGTNATGGGSNPNAHGGNPNAGGTNAIRGGSNPNAHGGNPNAHGGNPNAGGTSVISGGSNPNAHGGNPNAGGTNVIGGGSTNAHGGNPNAGGANAQGSNSQS